MVCYSLVLFAGRPKCVIARPDPMNVLFVGAHPDDIEFMMAGTLILLARAGFQIHMWNVTNGCYGGISDDKNEIARKRWEESKASASIAGAVLHAPIADDMSVFYGDNFVRKACAVVRDSKPCMIFIPAPDDYVEDHINTSRIVVSGAFARAINAFESEPPLEAWNGKMTIYHALPFGLTDQLARPVCPEIYVDIASVFDKKAEMLRCHSSQGIWLSESQGTLSFVENMELMAKSVGGMSREFRLAEGWRRHSHIGFCGPDDNPIEEILRDKCYVDHLAERY
ncbi:MAG: PIG-L family deacetylase [Actinomycetota bacterium]|nr:PIG-L family deacetylase [Actinomycetota bacterium]